MTDHDTDDAANAAQVAIWRGMSGDRRLRVALAMSEDARAISLAGIHGRHPEYGPSEARYALYRMLLGDALFAAAYPRQPLLEP